MYVRSSFGILSGVANPSSQNQVFSLAADFITGGSSPVTLPFKEFPELTLQCSQYYYEYANIHLPLESVLTFRRADRSSVTFSGAFKQAAKDFGVTKDTPIYAVFFSGLQKVRSLSSPLVVSHSDSQTSLLFKSASLPAMLVTTRSTASLPVSVAKSTSCCPSHPPTSQTKTPLPASPYLRSTRRARFLRRPRESAIERIMDNGAFGYCADVARHGHEKQILVHRYPNT